ncbi:1-(5-phosphoribosyl)-5-[(5-phosphoribosylamino)methylideneamino] imidazole-4-carboxamide isomerase [Aggregicoccus sp. 17bor-14]|uniref:1-(5-phosphoribosyl)-5-[(5- phosphoribosylamino)methylideneamino]imidazole-4- carboxamide isomerase n=1 Tax=Myxococcaceae TaxID=31 RepID=UPI00129D0162|nr:MULTISPECIES: 1-(5-phosphoribosyl)-5-[(5-phosphoribosylamino)methylideneamino] imidazole-4-carboxamide isomerase [Myxococcaceae]MBF5044152.1 1-(5-phosphoribosyl)-5-[(5-phosphoribosylamino)methylideneamino] imidazole-4-carboxamide isomerase [Simulacricoccus sp. 17bor-14]MRI89902.1 1-(5-phosphoribosyl)-5-[(5-phosphoribosylamino)methylideneamino] imidazole-4-carboxamide isomerase [Aggregicoccus sp. 17bor-14]
MIAIPAIDLRDGACVQLVGGAYDAERVRLPDPLAALQQWRDLGFTTFHVVDLDAATGRGTNAGVVAQLLSQPGLTFTVGGGVREEERIEALLAQGAGRVVVGTRAIEDAAWLADVADRFPNKLVVAADVKGREVVTRGWASGSARDIADVLAALAPLPIAGLLVTAVHKEGQLGGVDLALMEEVVRRSQHRLYASGGVTTLEDLRALARVGAYGAVVGMALYTGTLDARAVAQEFA